MSWRYARTSDGAWPLKWSPARPVDHEEALSHAASKEPPPPAGASVEKERIPEGARGRRLS